VKKFFSFPYLIVFALGLLLGLRASFDFPSPEEVEEPWSAVQEASPKQAAAPAQRLSLLGSGQRSIMIVVADQLGAETPKLESVWLALYVPDEPSLTMMPVFPGTHSKQNLESPLPPAFGLETVGGQTRLSESFTAAVKETGIWWSGIILLDKEALQLISRSMIEGDSEQKNSPFFTAVNRRVSKGRFPSVWSEPHSALHEQAHFIEDLCWQASHSSHQEEPELPAVLAEIMPDHMTIDFDLDQLMEEITILRSFGKQLACKFPSLQLTAQAHN
jgi:hypothetical protein